MILNYPGLLLWLQLLVSAADINVPVKISCKALVTSSSLHCLGAQIPQRIGVFWP